MLIIAFEYTKLLGNHCAWPSKLGTLITSQKLILPSPLSSSSIIAVVTEPQPKKPRIARRSEFLASDSDNEEEDLTSKGDETLQLDDGGREEGGKTSLKKTRKLALDSSDSSSSGTESESDNDSRSSGVEEDQSSGVNLSQDGSDRVQRCQNIATDLQSPVMDTAELLVDTCDPAKHDSSRMTPANTD